MCMPPEEELSEDLTPQGKGKSGARLDQGERLALLGKLKGAARHRGSRGQQGGRQLPIAECTSRRGKLVLVCIPPHTF